jgi:hypothetical protein
MEDADLIDWTGSGLAFGLLISSFLMMFFTIWFSQRKKRH